MQANTQRLPLRDWQFGARVARGKHAASVIATHGSEGERLRRQDARQAGLPETGPSLQRGFILHYRGKAGWLLDGLPAGERPDAMWVSEEGGLWTAGTLRWRDTESMWHEAALPEGLQAPTVALSEDGTQVWLSATVGGAAKIFSTDANAGVPAATP